MLKFRPLLVPTLIAIPAIALMAALGIWQLQRLAWKEGLIAAVEARMGATPVALSAVLALAQDDAEYRVVEVRGRFLHDKEAYLFAISRDQQPGAHVVTPMELAGGGVVLVDRGFVPASQQAPETRPEGQIAGEVTVIGVVRGPQKPGMFTPEPDLDSRLWFVRNPTQMAAALGVSLLTPYMIEAGAAPNRGGLPLGGQTIVNFPNDHLAYAYTWFGLALALLAVYLIYHHSKQRLRFR